MKVQEIMERVGTTNTGRAIAYIKDALEEINKISKTHFETQRVDISKDQRFYSIPFESTQLLDIRMKNQLNNRDEYKSIPRMIGEPSIEDADGV